MSNTSYDVNVKDHVVVPRYVMSLFTVEEFYQFWPQIEEMLDTVPHTWRHWTKDEIYSAVTAGKMQAWGIGPPQTVIMVLLTSVNVFPALRTLTVLWAAGTLEDEMLPLILATFADYAKLNSCSEVEIRGRPGWSPKLKPFGYRHDASIWTCPVPVARMN